MPANVVGDLVAASSTERIRQIELLSTTLYLTHLPLIATLAHVECSMMMMMIHISLVMAIMQLPDPSEPLVCSSITCSLCGSYCRSRARRLALPP